MNISIKNSNGTTSINIVEREVNYVINTDEKYDEKGNQHISSSIIDARGFENPIMAKRIIMQELSRKGVVIDNE